LGNPTKGELSNVPPFESPSTRPKSQRLFGIFFSSAKEKARSNLFRNDMTTSGYRFPVRNIVGFLAWSASKPSLFLPAAKLRLFRHWRDAPCSRQLSSLASQTIHTKLRERLTSAGYTNLLFSAHVIDCLSGHPDAKKITRPDGGLLSLPKFSKSKQKVKRFTRKPQMQSSRSPLQEREKKSGAGRGRSTIAVMCLRSEIVLISAIYFARFQL
jgi:hypothetical protein